MATREFRTVEKQFSQQASLNSDSNQSALKVECQSVRNSNEFILATKKENKMLRVYEVYAAMHQRKSWMGSTSIQVEGRFKRTSEKQKRSLFVSWVSASYEYNWASICRIRSMKFDDDWSTYNSAQVKSRASAELASLEITGIHLSAKLGIEINLFGVHISLGVSCNSANFKKKLRSTDARECTMDSSYETRKYEAKNFSCQFNLKIKGVGM